MPLWISVAQFSEIPAKAQSSLRLTPSRRSACSIPKSMILDLAEDVEFFHTADDVAYARIERDGHHEVWPLGSKSLRAWLSRRFHQAHDRAPGGQALRDALDVLMGRALFEGSECPVYVRVASHGDDIYLDLGDPLWQAVRITAAGWEIVADPPVRFRRPKGLLPLPMPVRGAPWISSVDS